MVVLNRALNGVWGHPWPADPPAILTPSSFGLHVDKNKSWFDPVGVVHRDDPITCCRNVGRFFAFFVCFWAYLVNLHWNLPTLIRHYRCYRLNLGNDT